MRLQQPERVRLWEGTTRCWASKPCVHTCCNHSRTNRGTLRLKTQQWTNHNWRRLLPPLHAEVCLQQVLADAMAWHCWQDDCKLSIVSVTQALKY